MVVPENPRSSTGDWALFLMTSISSKTVLLSDVGDLRASPLGSGALLFVDTNGRLVDTFKHEYLKHPSAVKMVGKKAGQFVKGDILVTEKAGHCLVWLRSDGILRGHFRFSNATDNDVADRY